jgi:hypothetical protein
VSGIRDSLGRTDLQLLHEALTYARKRTFLPADSVRLQGVLDRVEELLLDSVVASDDAANDNMPSPGPGTPARTVSLRLSPPEQTVLRREIMAYCEALTRRGGSPEGAREAKRLHEILEILTGAHRRLRWLKRILGVFGR